MKCKNYFSHYNKMCISKVMRKMDKKEQGLFLRMCRASD